MFFATPQSKIRHINKCVALFLVCSAVSKITLHTLTYHLMLLRMVLVRGLGSRYQVWISFENLPGSRDFPGSRLQLYVALSMKSLKWFDPITTFHRAESWGLERNGFAQDPREWASQSLWHALSSWASLVLLVILCVCSLVGGMEQRMDAEECYEIRTGSQDSWALLSASLDICKMNVWMKCAKTLIHLTNMNCMFTLYQLQCTMRWL